MCIAHTPAPVRSRQRNHLWIAVQSRDVVDDLRSGIDGGMGDRGLACVD